MRLMYPVPAIVVLEDDNRRITQMRRVADESLSSFDCVFFDNARHLRSWLQAHLAWTVLISLDCDLDSTAIASGSDVGSGDEVAEYLASLPSSCPVIIHSSNALRAPGMHMTLSMAGWSDVKLAPFANADSWLADVLEALDLNEP
jgi:hypothetical protein